MRGSLRRQREVSRYTVDLRHAACSSPVAMHSRKLLTLLVPAGVLLTASAHAAEPCESEAWFCEESEAEEAAEETTRVTVTESKDSEGDAKETPPDVVKIDTRKEKPKKAASARSVVVYESKSSSASGYDGPSKRSPSSRRDHAPHFGFNVRLASVLMEHNDSTHPDAGMGGVGVGFRFMPTPYFALEPGIDGYGGIDTEGNERTETTLSFNAMFFLNPDDPVQIYGLIGAFSTAAELKEDGYMGSEPTRYSYVGGQVGAGLELRLGPALAFNVDLIGYARQRNELEEPDENPDALRRDSGGGLFRGGMSLYF